ncbi:MAG: VWA domain-containing protein [Granulosicoccus sp.]|nr:VWA domain-containing protein [Granulosicoccus sp.]
MNTLLSGTLLAALTVATVSAYPWVNGLRNAQDTSTHTTMTETVNELASPTVDVVFVLDTTSSMSELIQTAKEKIWSIATTMSSAQQSPEFRIGLVGFRDRGDDYVTRIIDLSSDVDSVYAALMDFSAAGGGDGPESVNQALHDAVNRMAWSQDANAYKAIFLVGDAPPHMDYQNDIKYPQSAELARQHGIVINAIQCGNQATTAKVWQSIAQLGGGKYFQVEQAGSAVALTTPYDDEMARLAAELDDTRLYYGSSEEKARMEAKQAATNKLKAESSISALARRGAFNASASGRRNLLGEQELVEAVSTGSVSLEDLEADALPAAISKLKPQEQRQAIADIASQRNDVQGRLTRLAEERNRYLEAEISKDSDAADSLDRKLYDTVREQAARSGLDYRDGPAY